MKSHRMTTKSGNNYHNPILTQQQSSVYLIDTAPRNTYNNHDTNPNNTSDSNNSSSCSSDFYSPISISFFSKKLTNRNVNINNNITTNHCNLRQNKSTNTNNSWIGARLSPITSFDDEDDIVITPTAAFYHDPTTSMPSGFFQFHKSNYNNNNNNNAVNDYRHKINKYAFHNSHRKSSLSSSSYHSTSSSSSTASSAAQHATATPMTLPPPFYYPIQASAEVRKQQPQSAIGNARTYPNDSNNNATTIASNQNKDRLLLYVQPSYDAITINRSDSISTRESPKTRIVTERTSLLHPEDGDVLLLSDPTNYGYKNNNNIVWNTNNFNYPNYINYNYYNNSISKRKKLFYLTWGNLVCITSCFYLVCMSAYDFYSWYYYYNVFQQQLQQQQLTTYNYDSATTSYNFDNSNGGTSNEFDDDLSELDSAISYLNNNNDEYNSINSNASNNTQSGVYYSNGYNPSNIINRINDHIWIFPLGIPPMDTMILFGAYTPELIVASLNQTRGRLSYIYNNSNDDDQSNINNTNADSSIKYKFGLFRRRIKFGFGSLFELISICTIILVQVVPSFFMCSSIVEWILIVIAWNHIITNLLLHLQQQQGDERQRISQAASSLMPPTTTLQDLEENVASTINDTGSATKNNYNIRNGRPLDNDDNNCILDVITIYFCSCIVGQLWMLISFKYFWHQNNSNHSNNNNNYYYSANNPNNNVSTGFVAWGTCGLLCALGCLWNHQSLDRASTIVAAQFTTNFDEVNRPRRLIVQPPGTNQKAITTATTTNNNNAHNNASVSDNHDVLQKTEKKHNCLSEPRTNVSNILAIIIIILILQQQRTYNNYYNNSTSSTTSSSSRTFYHIDGSLLCTFMGIMACALWGWGIGRLLLILRSYDDNTTTAIDTIVPPRTKGGDMTERPKEQRHWWRVNNVLSYHSWLYEQKLKWEGQASILVLLLIMLWVIPILNLTYYFD